MSNGPDVWFAAMDQDGNVLLMGRYADYVSDWISAHFGRDNPSKLRVVECIPPKFTQLARVKCDACAGKGTVLKTYGAPPAEQSGTPEGGGNG